MGLGTDESPEYTCKIIQSRYWIEVLIVIVEGAGKSREIQKINSDKKMVSEEMIWVNNQHLVLDHICSAEKVWGIKIVHGKKVGNEWRDFIVVGKCFTSNLYLTSNILDSDTIKDINRIWKYAKDQMLSDNPLMLIYSDVGDSVFIPDGKKAINPLRGKAWYKHEYPDLPTNFAFIFPGAKTQTVAHELGHIVAYFIDIDDKNSTDIMSHGNNRKASKKQKKNSMLIKNMST